MVSKRTAHILSCKNQYARRHGRDLTLGKLKSLGPDEAQGWYNDPYEKLAVRINLEQIAHLDKGLAEMEKACWKAAARMKNDQALRSLPGI